MKPTPFHYIIIRKELTGGAALAQVAHAAGESASLWSLGRLVNAAVAGSPGVGRPISFGAERGTFIVATSTAAPVDPLEHLLPVDTRLAVLGATKEQLATVLGALLRENIAHKAITETDGPLAGMVTTVGLVTEDREALKPILGELRPFKLS